MKKIFTYNEEINKNAYLNWRTNRYEPIKNLQVLADGYMESSIELAKICLKDNTDKKADILIFPILFSLNQGIELFEKSIYYCMNILLGHKNKYPNNHKIREIWYAVKNKIIEYGFDEAAGRGEKEFKSMIHPLENYLDELYFKIGKSGDINMAYHNIDFSRYPLNNRGEVHFYIDIFDNEVVDLEVFVEVAKKIFDCLSCLSRYYYNIVIDKWNTK